MKAIDITGQRFGSWVAIRQDMEAKTLHQKWICKCDCGATRSVLKSSLRTGVSTSCGCTTGRKSVRAPGKIVRDEDFPVRTHRIWARMKSRCFNPKAHAYSRYGGRGITVCERWMEFENFLADMGVAPPNHSLERVDVNGNYEPSNCVWADSETQNNNMRGQRKYLVNGEWLGLMQLSRYLGLSKFKTKKLLPQYQTKIIGENDE